jgi:hypothetical protein
MIGFPGVLRDGFVPLCGNDTGIGVVLIRMECGLPTAHRRDLDPLLFDTVTTAISDMEAAGRRGRHTRPYAGIVLHHHGVQCRLRGKVHLL